MKKLFSMLMVMVVVLALTACAGKDGNRQNPSDTLYVGLTEFNGDFMPGFGNSSYDKFVKDLVFGSGTVQFTKGGEFVINDTVVDSYTATLDDDGNKTYTFTIKTGLKFDDGSAITARDYVYSIMLLTSRSYADAGASTGAYSEFLGYADFHNAVDPEDSTKPGGSDTFTGVDYISDTQFSVTIAADQLPYYYELSLVGVDPYPENTYKPSTGGEIYKDASGDEFVVDGSYVEENYRGNPKGAGSYRFVKSVKDQYIELELNEYYAGDYRGEVAEIPKLIMKVVPDATNMDSLLAGEIDVLTGVVDGEKIEAGIASEYVEAVTFKRNGYGQLAIHTDMPIVNDYRVRQAVAYLIDREGFVEKFLGGYGAVVHAPYGLGQWMFQESEVVPNDLIQYSYDLDAAIALLEAAGWTKGYDADGNMVDYDDEANEMGTRYNAQGEKLRLKWMATQSGYSDLLAPIMRAGFSQAGIQLTVDFVDFATLLDAYYNESALEPKDREYHMFNLATGFADAFDPYWSYHSDQYGTWMNSNQFLDTEDNPQLPSGKTIDELTVELRSLDPNEDGARDTYLGIWEEYIIRMNTLMPNVPLYSNEYYHFANSAVEGFEASSFWDWTDSIVDMSITK